MDDNCTDNDFWVWFDSFSPTLVYHATEKQLDCRVSCRWKGEHQTSGRSTNFSIKLEVLNSLREIQIWKLEVYLLMMFISAFVKWHEFWCIMYLGVMLLYLILIISACLYPAILRVIEFKALRMKNSNMISLPKISSVKSSVILTFNAF